MYRRRTQTSTIEVGGVSCEVTFKDVKRLRMRVTSPEGRVLVSAPWSVDIDDVLAFIRSNHSWILRAQERMRMVPPKEPLVDGGRARLWGQWREVRIADGPRASARLVDGRIEITAPDPEGRTRALDALYRRELEAVVPGLHEQWAEVTGRPANRFRYRRMTSRWGSCQIRTGAITLNISLAEHAPRSLEYVMVHELAHLWVSAHDASFYALMDAWLPDWRARRAEIRGRA